MFTPVPRARFQLDNHLGSASLEVEESGLVIGYEEYHPYGTTAYASGRGGVEVSGKRYRYTGKERDEETGLYYHGARHYAAWLGRWTSADPILRSESNYSYAANSPIVKNDLDGRDPGGGGDATKSVEQMQYEKSFNDRSQMLAVLEAPKPVVAERSGLVRVQRVEQALMTSIANVPNTFVYGLKYIGLNLTGHIREGSSYSEEGTAVKTVSKDESARSALDETSAWRMTPPPGTESLSSAYDVVLPLFGAAVLGGNPKPGVEPAPGALLAESKKTVTLVGAAAADAAPSVPQGVTPEQFQAIGRILRDDARVSAIGEDIRVHGSRAAGTANLKSDLDLAIRVDPDTFGNIVEQRFGTPNAGSAKARTKLHAEQTGKVQTGEAGLRGVRNQVQEALGGMEVDLSVIKQNGPFDKGPWVDVPMKASQGKIR